MAKGSIEIDRERCKGCHLCLEFCPKKVLKISKELNDTGYFPAEFILKEGKDGCTGCTLCAVVCPDMAIVVFRG